MEVVQVCDLRLRPVLVQGFGRCPPNTTQIVGWVVEGVLRGRSGDLALILVPLGWVMLICYLVSFDGGWKGRSETRSFVSCGETVA